MKLQERTGRAVFVCPPMGDEGLSIGAALLAHHERSPAPPAAHGVPFLAAVLGEYEKHSGQPALINASFNLHGEPIVGNLGDAVRAFAAAQLDYLLVEACLVEYLANAERLRQWRRRWPREQG